MRTEVRIGAYVLAVVTVFVAGLGDGDLTVSDDGASLDMEVTFTGELG